jgi:hypothetical protein
VKVEATMFDDAAEPVPDDTPLFRRVESLERGPRRPCQCVCLTLFFCFI